MSFHRCFLSTYYVLMLGMRERGQTAHILMEHSAQASPSTEAPRVGPESSLSSHSRSESRPGLGSGSVCEKTTNGQRGGPQGEGDF